MGNSRYRGDDDGGPEVAGDDMPRSSAAINRLATRYPGVERRNEDHLDETPIQIDDVFEAIDREISMVSESLHMLEDKLGPYLRLMPSPDEEGSSKEPSSDRSALFEQLVKYPNRLRRLRMHVESIYERVDR